MTINPPISRVDIATATTVPGPPPRTGRRNRIAPPMDVAVSYTRSCDGRAVERQAAACEAYLDATGLTLGATYCDVSGGTTDAGRDGLAAMMAAARRGEFGVLVIEDVDRLSRDPVFLALILRAFVALGVEVHSVSNGVLHGLKAVFRGLMGLAMRGLMGDEMREVHGRRIAFVLHAMARRGLSPTPPCHGYANVPGEPGRLVVDPDQAVVVKQAFGMRLAGMTLGGIAASLGGQASSRRVWTQASIGRLLRNPLYRGELIYGRRTRYRDPMSGRMVSVPAPPSAWTVTPVEQLRIVDDATWDAVQETFRVDPGKGRRAGAPCEA